MMEYPEVRAVHTVFTRHDRHYCLFSLTGRDEDFLYYSHDNRPLRSLMFGRGFNGQLPGLMRRKDLCIECGLGLSVDGGVALDDGDLIAWHCTAEEANGILAGLKVVLGAEGQWIDLF